MNIMLPVAVVAAIIVLAFLIDVSDAILILLVPITVAVVISVEYLLKSAP